MLSYDNANFKEYIPSFKPLIVKCVTSMKFITVDEFCNLKPVFVWIKYVNFLLW
jgi:hypothetical protein